MADDLMQITFLKVHRSRHTYRPGLALRPWLFTIAARVRIDALRSHYRLVEEWDEEKIARAEAAAAVEQVSADSGDVRERVRAAIDALPETQRVVIQLHRYEGLSFAEIASILASTEGAIRIRAFRAYGALRVALSDLAKPEGMEVA